MVLGSWLWAKLKGWAALVGAMVLAMGYAYWKGRRGGIADAQVEVQKKTTKVQERFDEIDRSKPDFDGAIRDLRDRSLEP